MVMLRSLFSKCFVRTVRFGLGPALLLVLLTGGASAQTATDCYSRLQGVRFTGTFTLVGDVMNVMTTDGRAYRYTLRNSASGAVTLDPVDPASGGGWTGTTTATVSLYEEIYRLPTPTESAKLELRAEGQITNSRLVEGGGRSSFTGLWLRNDCEYALTVPYFISPVHVQQGNDIPIELPWPWGVRGRNELAYGFYGVGLPMSAADFCSDCRKIPATGLVLSGSASYLDPNPYYPVLWHMTWRLDGSPPCTFSITPARQTFAPSAGTGSVAVSASDATCKWTATSSAPWVTITSGASANGSGVVTYAVAANAEPVRWTILNIAGQEFTVSQGGGGGGGGCAYNLSPLSATVAAAASSGSINVVESGLCAWTATSNAPWLTVTSGGSEAIGDRTVSYSVAANTSGSQRTGTLTVAGQMVTIVQASASNCFYTLSPGSVVVPYSGQTGSFVLGVSGSACSWTASSNRTWAQVGPPLSGSTGGTLSYRVFANFGSVSRTATFTVADGSFTITQEASVDPALSRFVRLLYFGFLGRSASAAEIAAQMNSGLSREALANNFFNSLEFKAGGRFVAALYVALLQRDAEYGGWQFQRLALADSGGGQNAMAQAFIGTPEFVLRYGVLSDTAFIQQMYQNLLGRPPSQAEINFQLPNIQGTNGRGAFITAMLQVPEFDRTNLSRLQALLLYSSLLMRDSSVAERTARINELQTPGALANIIASFVNSAEMNALLQ